MSEHDGYELGEEATGMIAGGTVALTTEAERVETWFEKCARAKCRECDGRGTIWTWKCTMVNGATKGWKPCKPCEGTGLRWFALSEECPSKLHENVSPDPLTLSSIRDRLCRVEALAEALFKA